MSGGRRMIDVLAHVPQAEPPEPKDSALGLVLRGREVLFGRRSKRSRFMPGHLVFPGGRMEPQDRPDEPGAFARCCAREFEEEAGIAVPPEDWTDIGERITPPLFPVRFRTRFFLAALPEGATLPVAPPSPGEIDELAFRDPSEVLDAWRAGQALIPPPVLPMLRGLAASRDPERLAKELAAANAREQVAPRIEFVPDVWILPLRTRTLPPATHTNAWMPGGERFVILDPGATDERELDRLLRVVERRRVLGAQPEAVLLTHGHPDHVGGAAAVCRALGVPLRAHPLAFERQELDDLGGVRTEAVEDGARFDLGGLTLTAHHSPGHSPDHLAFACPERDLLFSGDLVSGLSTIVVLPPPEGEMGAFLDSLERMSALGHGRLAPAHGPPLPGKALQKVLAHRRMREGKIRAALNTVAPQGRGIEALAEIAYDDAPDAAPFLTQAQTLAHLLHLEANGAVCRDGEIWTGTPSPNHGLGKRPRS